MNLEGKVAVVTGGSKGIGKAIAHSLAGLGCQVAITARNETELKKAEEELQKYPVKVLGVKSDVTNPKDVEKLVKLVEKTLGTATILVNNAGIGKFTEVIKMSDEDFRDTLETNLFGVFYCSKAFLPGMIQKEGGYIVNIASLAGKNSFAGGAAYCASKHALISFSECLMLEVRHQNIKVTAVCPGSVDTTFGNSHAGDKSWALTSEDVADAVIDVLKSSGTSLISLVEMRPLKPQKH